MGTFELEETTESTLLLGNDEGEATTGTGISDSMKLSSKRVSSNHTTDGEGLPAGKMKNKY